MCNNDTTNRYIKGTDYINKYMKHEIAIHWNIQEFRKWKVGGVTSSQKTIRYLYRNTVFTKQEGYLYSSRRKTFTVQLIFGLHSE